jgi:hypothetical protein
MGFYEAVAQRASGCARRCSSDRDDGVSPNSRADSRTSSDASARATAGFLRPP